MRTGHTHISKWRLKTRCRNCFLFIKCEGKSCWGVLLGAWWSPCSNFSKSFMRKGYFRVLSFRCVLTKITCICCTGQGDDSAAPKRSQNRDWCGWFDCWRLANIGRRGKILDFFGEIQCYCVLTVLLIVETFAEMYFSSTHPPPPPSWTNFMEYSAKQAQWNKPSVNRGG